MAARKINLYLDVVSPFAYIAYFVTRHSPVFANCHITYTPVFLGGILKACNNTSPIFVKNKNKWTNTERLRWSKFLNVPMYPDMPKGFPILTMSVQRALCAIPAEQLPACFDALYKELWVEGNSQLNAPKTFLPILEAAVGKEMAANALEQSNTQPIKDLLIANSDKAVETGAFGIPWFECTNSSGETECFWGVDRMAQVAAFLGLETTADQGFRAMM
ncbi:hypothetical protein, variant [Blastomyces gilchristii SLH14081]|uniref:Glutathione S-transferase kappa n=1 Tax=Blastomyces gilchristii (strain SLH14081) TaxID=559298 RepID=A0A179UEE6_BLAGS|nr:uncharacterized protein BDBG_02394 [Blastomyces gilchristii SLH14081]XP_031577044.1 hypothetical protein, variant [Blastomyces gilchristii SLH14081]OAT06112.1 hypothetical protein BDBG_02394 [Blastomyces gilchristii SLH14081]OAT06113.1 hypothetical protein, variant [Blastomyces gilchristii SLH14081]